MAVSIERESELARKYMCFIKGLPMSTMYKREIIEEILEFEPDDEDVIIATFPKTGTTWVWYIAQQILTKGESFPSFNDSLGKVMPYLEMTGVSAVKELTTKPRLYRHYMPYNIMKKNTKTKIIYAYRKPEDALVSYYHFLNNLNQSYDFNEFFEDYLKGDVPRGLYFDHILTYLVHKNDGNTLFIQYEKLHRNKKEQILRLAKFLGNEYYDNLIQDDSILYKTMEHTTFDYMKKKLPLYLSEDPKNDQFLSERPRIKVTFFRKGVVGDGKNHLNENQARRLKELAQNKMKGTKILEEWYGH